MKLGIRDRATTDPRETERHVRRGVSLIFGHLEHLVAEIHVTVVRERGAEPGNDVMCTIRVRPKKASSIVVNRRASTADDAIDWSLARTAIVLQRVADRGQRRTRAARGQRRASRARA